MKKLGWATRTAIAVVLLMAAGAGVAVAGRLGRAVSLWAWREGSSSVYVGQPANSNALVLHAPAGIDLRASHVRIMSDSDFVLAHSTKTPDAQVNGYYIGTATRTPIQIGADSNPTTALVVAGTAGQRADLQQWTLSGKTVAAIDGKGRLRLGQITLDPELVNGRVVLYALVDGKREVLAQGTSAP